MKNNFQTNVLNRVFSAFSKDQSLGLPRHWKVITTTFLLLFTMGIGQMWGANGDVLFSQGFGSATAVAYAANTARTYSTSSTLNGLVGNEADLFQGAQCNAKSSCGLGINTTSGANSFATAGKFQAYADNTSWQWALYTTRNFASTAPTAIKFEMDVIVKYRAGTKQEIAVVVGSGFSVGTGAPAADKGFTGFNIISGGSASGKHCIGKVGSTTKLETTGYISNNSEAHITWVINNTGSSLTYKNPSNADETVATGTYDLWVGTTKVLNDQARAATGSSAFTGSTMQNLYIGNAVSGKHEAIIDNVKVTDLTPAAPSCSTPDDPTGLAVESTTADGATFTITDGANTNNYEIVCKTTTGAPAVDATPTKTGTAKTLAVTGLEEGTTYYAWVRSVCDADHKSDWVSLSGTFTTKSCSISSCGNASLTYVIKVGSSGSQATDGSDFITTATPSNPTALGASKTVGLNTITITDGAMKAAAATSACFSTKPNMTGKIGVYNGTSYSSSNYLQFAFTVKEGYTFTPCDIRLVVQPVDVATSFRWEITNGTTVYGYGTETDVPKGSDGGASVLMGLTSTAEMAAGSYYIRLYPYTNAASKTFRLGTDVVLRGTTAEAVAPTGYSVTYEENGHGAAQTDLTGQTALPNPLPELSESGWDFGGWFIDNNTFETAAVAGATLTADATLYAKWTEAAPAAVCPSGISISGTTSYTEGETIELTAALEAGNGEISYQWYKGSIAAGNEVGTNSNVLTIASCATTDAGNYYCVASKDACSNAESSAYAITVAAAPTPCFSFVPKVVTAQESITVGDELSVVTGGSIVASAGTYTYETAGLLVAGNSSSYMTVTLPNLIAENTQINVEIYFAANTTKRGLKLCSVSSTDDIANGNLSATFTEAGTKNLSYTVKTGDAIIGANVFRLYRNNNIYVKSITVTDCGAELFDLSSDVSVAGKATVTLSANKLVSGATATATYSAIDAAYDFDEWVVSGTGASIDDAKANPVTITMGSADATVTLKLKLAPVKHTVTYYDGTTELGTELVVESENPTGAGLAPRKLGFTFTGWSTTTTGEAAALNTISVAADMPLYAVWSAVNCSAQSGTIYTMSIDVAPLANCTITSTTGTHDLYQYGGVSGGEALLGNKGTSNNCILQTNKTILLKDDNSYLKLDFDCPLKEGDKIVYNVSGNNPFVSIATSRPSESAALAVLDRSKTEFVIPAASGLIDAQTIYVWKGGGNTTITSINIYRPAHYAVTFNMHDHGTAPAAQSVVEGGKVTKPADPSASGWDFVNWYKESTYDNVWDFNNDVVNAATEIHAKWTEHVASSDATLSSLSYTIGGGAPIAIALVTDQYDYAVELPMGADINEPEIAAVANDPNAKPLNIVQTNLGQATVTVTAENNTTIKNYTITFSAATSKDIQLVFKTGTTPCVGSASTASQILSNNAAVSTYINQITFTNVEGTGDDGAEGSSLNVGKKAGNMFTLSAKPGYAMQSMNFLAKIQDANCEYSINGGDWTTLTSTDTGNDVCYAPFTSGTVHEFRLRSTGAEGVWIRNMQLTIVEACTPVAITWDEEPVEFEVGAAGQVIAATANTGNDVEYSSNAPLVIAVDAVSGLLSVGELGSATLSASTAEGDGTTYCANGGAAIVLSKVVNTYYLVSFDGQNGEAVNEVKYYSGDAAIALPATDPTFAGYDFQGWFDAETGGNQYTEAITPAASMTVYAQWVAQCAGATIDVQPTGASYLTGRTATALICEATAGNGGALTYEWFTCDDELKTNPVAATATPSTAVAGTFYYFCKVTEAGCGVEAFSNVVTITVTDKDAICLVKAELAPGSSAASITSTSGYYKDDANIAINIKKDLKLGSTGNYVKVAIDGANFQDGDVVEITLASDKTASAWLQIFTDEGTTMVAEMTSGVSREHPNYLTISGVPADTKTLYLYRTEAADGNMNPYPTSMAVYRTCAPILNKMTVAGVDGTPDNTNHIAIEVPFSTTDDALDAIVYDWVSNSDAWTAAHTGVAANAWEFGVENTVTFADKDGDESVYYITISKAEASSDATLSALTVNGQAIALADGVYEYSFELPYGTSVVPTVVATANHIAAVATVDPCTLNGATITVVPESGVSYQKVYTLNFTISAWKEVVIFDGSYMTALTASPTDEKELRWEVEGFNEVAKFEYQKSYGEAYCSDNDKTYSVENASGKYEYYQLKSGGTTKNSRYFKIAVPAGYVAKFYVVYGSHSQDTEAKMYVDTQYGYQSPTDQYLLLSTSDRYQLTGGMSEIVGTGDYYLNVTSSADFAEIRVYMRPGYKRNAMLGAGVYGTVCVDHNVAIEDIHGISVYELRGRENTYGKLVFDEIVSGEMEAGVPYVFMAEGNEFLLYYGNTKADNPVVAGNGMYGTFKDITLPDEDLGIYDLNDIYYFAQRALWSCDGAIDLTIPANRAYVKLSEIDYLPANDQPAPGRRRVTMAVNGEKVVTDIDNLFESEQPVKVMIDGQLFIIRGEKMFDATGRLVK